MTLDIRFVPIGKVAATATQHPKPARSYIPEWWKGIDSFLGGKADYLSDSSLNTSVKHCMPYIDALTGGYIQELSSDVYIDISKNSKDEFVIKINHSLQIPGLIPVRYRTYPKGSNIQRFPEGYYPIEFTWSENWIVDTPDGWSTLYTHPMNRYDLPFITMSGMVDTDRGRVNVDGSIPFYIKEGFSGVIPAGTPIYQMIPVKREPWKSDIEEYSEYRYFRDLPRLKKYFTGGYVKNIWHKKRYE